MARKKAVDGRAYESLKRAVENAKGARADRGDGMRQFTADELRVLMDAVEDARTRQKEVERLEGDLYAVYETGRQKGLDSARWLAMELSRARIRPCWDKCAKCSDYGADACACYWVQASIDAVKEKRR